MKVHAGLHFSVGITIRKGESALHFCMVDVREMPTTFTLNLPARFFVCNKTEVSFLSLRCLHQEQVLFLFLLNSEKAMSIFRLILFSEMNRNKTKPGEI